MDREPKAGLELDSLVRRIRYNYPYPSVIDQREIQRLHNACLRYPYSCLIAIVIDAFIGLDSSPRIADLTYGVGSFYTVFRKYIGYLAGIDVKKWDWLVEPDTFLQGFFESRYRELPEKSFDVVVFDPPFETRPTSKIHVDQKPWLYHRVEPVGRMIKELPKVLEHLMKPRGIFVAKIMDPTMDGAVALESSHYALVETLASAGYRLAEHIIFRHLSRNRPRIETQRFIKSHTHLLVFTR